MSTFGRLNYNFDSTKFGDGINLTDGQKLTLNYPSPLYTWQEADLSGSSVTNYFQNPHSANLVLMTTYTNQLIAYSNTQLVTYNSAPTEANTLFALATSLSSEITSFTDHTNRMSGVTESTNKLTTPDYQIAMSVGRQVLSITNQVDGVQNNAPILGNFTSLAIVQDVSNSVIQLSSSAATLNASLTVVGGNTYSSISRASMNTIISNVQTAYNLLNGRRVGDTTFYTNSVALVQDYNTILQFSNLGVNSSYLIKDLGIGTTKLQNNLLYSVPAGYPNNIYTSTSTATTTGTTGTTSSTTTAELTVTGVVPGSYTSANISVDAYGRIVYANNGGITLPQSINTTSDVTFNSLTTTTSITTSSLTASSFARINSLGVGTPASNVAGEIRATNEVTAYYSSDERLKENIKEIDAALYKLRKVRGVMFDWKDEVIEQRGGEDKYFVRKHDTGVIAQEVEQVLPEVVATRKDGYKAVRYEKLAGLIIQAINELADEVEEIKKRLE